MYMHMKFITHIHHILIEYTCNNIIYNTLNLKYRYISNIYIYTPNMAGQKQVNM